MTGRTFRLQRKGRGAMSNRAGRYERREREGFDDGWGGIEEEPPPLATEVTIDASRTAITRNDSPDLGFDRSINPYRGCEHGCIYCYARPSHAWLGLSPGQDFESRLLAKPDADRLLRAELARPGYRPRMIALGTNTDPYQPIERVWKVTRRILEVLDECRHPVGIVTKSALVLRDTDLIAGMARRRLARVWISLTTLDGALARSMEPRAATPKRRLHTIDRLAAAGVPVGVMFAPVIPGLNDAEMESVLSEARRAGADRAGYVLLRLPLEIKELFREWLAASEPRRAARVMALVRECRGGRDNDSAWGRRMRGNGAYAEMIARRFALACNRLGLDRRVEALDTASFARPAAEGDQLRLL